METTYKSDVAILQESLSKYKDKNGRKAKNLKLKIECFHALNKLAQSITDEDIIKSTTLLPSGTA